MNEFYNHHYIRTDASGNIVGGWSDGPHNARTPTEDDILINAKGGYQFRLYYYVGPVMQRSEENPSLFDGLGMIPLYKWDGEKVLRRSKDEIEADRAAIPEPPPSEAEQLRADVDFIAAMTGIEL